MNIDQEERKSEYVEESEQSEHVFLSNEILTPDSSNFIRLIEGLRTNTVTHLILKKCEISQEAAEALNAALMANTSLIELSLLEILDEEEDGTTADAFVFDDLDLSQTDWSDPPDGGETTLIDIATAALQANNKLTSLNFSSYEIDDESVTAIVSAINRSIILDLRNNPGIGDAGAAAIATALSSNPHIRLTALNLKSTGISGVGAAVIITEINGPTRLDLSGNPEIGDAGAVAIATALSSNPYIRLTTLSLKKTGISGVGAAAIIAEINRPRPTTLDLSDNSGIDDAWATAIATASSSNCDIRLITLNLSDNSGIGDAGAMAIAVALSPNPHIRIALKLKNAGISGVGAAAIIAASKNLTMLDFSNNPQIGDAGAKDIAEALSSNPNIGPIKLSLRRTGIDGVRAAPIIAKINRLTTLDLSGNHIGQRGIALDGITWKSKRLREWLDAKIYLRSAQKSTGKLGLSRMMMSDNDPNEGTEILILNYLKSEFIANNTFNFNIYATIIEKVAHRPLTPGGYDNGLLRLATKFNDLKLVAFLLRIPKVVELAIENNSYLSYLDALKLEKNSPEENAESFDASESLEELTLKEQGYETPDVSRMRRLFELNILRKSFTDFNKSRTDNDMKQALLKNLADHKEIAHTSFTPGPPNNDFLRFVTKFNNLFIVKLLFEIPTVLNLAMENNSYLSYLDELERSLPKKNADDFFSSSSEDQKSYEEPETFENQNYKVPDVARMRRLFEESMRSRLIDLKSRLIDFNNSPTDGRMDLLLKGLDDSKEAAHLSFTVDEPNNDLLRLATELNNESLVASLLDIPAVFKLAMESDSYLSYLGKLEKALPGKNFGTMRSLFEEASARFRLIDLKSRLIDFNNSPTDDRMAFLLKGLDDSKAAAHFSFTLGEPNNDLLRLATKHKNQSLVASLLDIPAVFKLAMENNSYLSYLGKLEKALPRKNFGIMRSLFEKASANVVHAVAAPVPTSLLQAPRRNSFWKENNRDLQHREPLPIPAGEEKDESASAAVSP